MAFPSRSISRIVPVLSHKSVEVEMDSTGEDAHARVVSHFYEEDQSRLHFPGAVKKFAYKFDGYGKFVKQEWDLTMMTKQAESPTQDHPHPGGGEFCWYHVELPRSTQRLATAAEYLIDVLCPPLKLQEILALVSSGPFCGSVDGALVFRVNSAGPCASKFTQRISALVTENRVISVSLGRIPRLDFSTMSTRSLLSEVPRIEPREDSETLNPNHPGAKFAGGVVIQEHVLEFLLTMNHLEEADNAVPRGVGNLLVHIIDTHVDHLHEIVLHLETQLDEVERELDTGLLSIILFFLLRCLLEIL